MASGLPALPFAGRAAHHGVPCVACDAAEERLVSAACAAGDAGTEFACALAATPFSTPTAPAAAPAPNFINARRPSLESVSPFAEFLFVFFIAILLYGNRAAAIPHARRLRVTHNRSEERRVGKEC